jgi:hypothetical protein
MLIRAATQTPGGHAADGAVADEGFAHGSLHSAKGGFAAEADLGFGGVDVDIYILGGEGEEDEAKRIACGGQQGMVGLDDGKSQAVVFDPTAVDEECDVVAIGPMEAGGADVAGDEE